MAYLVETTDQTRIVLKEAIVFGNIPLTLLGDLQNVSSATPSGGDVLAWDGVALNWKPITNTFNASNFATAAQGTTADTATQPGDNISGLTNDTGFITGITSSNVTTALGFTPQDASSAFDGAYGSLSNQPTIPSTTAELTNDANFITIADVPSGDYNDLSNLPTLVTAIGSLTDVNLAGVANGQTLIYNSASSSFVVGTIAGFSGDYNDLSNQPVIPTAVSDLTNDSNFISSITSSNVTTALGFTPQDAASAFDGAYASLSNQPTIPSTTAELTNDANFITAGDIPADSVTSVAGKTGIVTLNKADITDFAETDYATGAEGDLASSATQPGDNISGLTNDSGYITATTTIDGGTF